MPAHTSRLMAGSQEDLDRIPRGPHFADYYYGITNGPDRIRTVIKPVDCDWKLAAALDWLECIVTQGRQRDRDSRLAAFVNETLWRIEPQPADDADDDETEPWLAHSRTHQQCLLNALHARVPGVWSRVLAYVDARQAKQARRTERARRAAETRWAQREPAA